MEHLVIGIIVGFIMGLTGAGGALISIPLFIQLLDFNVKEATVLSLLAVILGTITNLLGQRKKIDFKIVILFVIFGGLANLASLPLKHLIPNGGIALLLLGIGIFSLWSVWQPPHVERKVIEVSTLITILIGLGLGLVTILTGLGGGVLLIPLLIKVYRKNYAEALPTSLMTILFISLISLFMQKDAALELISLQEAEFLSVGAVVAFGMLALLLRKLNIRHFTLLRQIVFSLVIFYSVTTVILQSF